jgi:hypothetical protein
MDDASDRFEVVVCHWHENAVGEEGRGPLIPTGRYPSREQAELAANQLECDRVDTEGGGAYGTWAYVREIPFHDLGKSGVRQ